MYLEDDDLGNVKLISNARAKRIIVRYRNGEFQLTHPVSVKIDEIEKTVVEMKSKLLKLKEKSAPKFTFTGENSFTTLTFRVEIKKNTLNNVYTTLKGGVLSITYPSNISLEGEEMQTIIRNTIENACRAEANIVLPARVKELAHLYNFKVGEVKINKSRGRWGSCSSKRNINLSYFCMMLSSHLVDFVILHELCHTKEMNHGPRFWSLLDSVSDDKAKELTNELKKVKLSIF